METENEREYPRFADRRRHLGARLASLVALVTHWLKRLARARRTAARPTFLAGLDRHMLADIGLTRSDLRDAFSEPFWEDPTALLRERAIERRMNRSCHAGPDGWTCRERLPPSADRPPGAPGDAVHANCKRQTADPSHRPLDPKPAIIPSRGRIPAPAGPSGGRTLFRDAKFLAAQPARAALTCRQGRGITAIPRPSGRACGIRSVCGARWCCRPGGGWLGAGADRLRPPRRRLLNFHDPQRRSGASAPRAASATRAAAPGASRIRARPTRLAICWLKNQVPPREEDKCCVSGVRGAGVIEPRRGAVEFSIDRLRRRLSLSSKRPRRLGRGLQGGVRGREQMPRLDLCAARLHQAVPALLSKGQDHAPAPQAVLHFGRGAVAAISAPN